MSTLTIHPIEYLKLHYHTDLGVIGKRLLVTCAKEIFGLAERAATVAVVFLTAGLILFACMQIGNSALIFTGFNNAITEMVVPPLQSLPMEM